MQHWHLRSLLAIALLVPLSGCNPEQASKAEDIAACDRLASHPRDPGRHAAGVADDQVAVGAAIEACERAVNSDRDLGRAWFQLGRAYWLANRDHDALGAFTEADNRSYSPASKFIGDAYLEGRGLPSGIAADPYVAKQWYEKSSGGGFREAGEALRALQGQLLDATQFKRPYFISHMYSGELSELLNDITFLFYAQGFAEQIGGDKILFVDSKCTPLVNEAGELLLGVRQIINMLRAATRKDSLVEMLKAIAVSSIVIDQGHRDAVTLVNEYKCDSVLAKRIVGNIMISFDQIRAAGLSKARR